MSAGLGDNRVQGLARQTCSGLLRSTVASSHRREWKRQATWPGRPRQLRSRGRPALLLRNMQFSLSSRVRVISVL